MRFKTMFTGIAAGLILGLAVTGMAVESNTVAGAAEPESAAAETVAAETAAVQTPVEAQQLVPTLYTTPDGVLSIVLPSSAWIVNPDPLRLFSATNGKDRITVDHYAVGERLLSTMVSEGAFDCTAMYQTLLSTENEVFVIKGFAEKRETLGDLMQIIGSIQILKFDTKTAVSQVPGVGTAGTMLPGETLPGETLPGTTLPAETPYQAVPADVRAFNATYYVTASALNVRSGASSEAPVVGKLTYGDSVSILGSVLQNGQDSGWLQISYNGAPAYASSSYLSAQRPAETQPATRAASNDDDEERINYREVDDDDYDDHYDVDFIEQEDDYDGEIFLD